MDRIVSSLFLFCTLILFAPRPATALITIDTVPVGDPGNPSGPFGFGSVAYAYEIGTYEVTVGQYTAFLNAVAATDTYELYDTAMATDSRIAGIERSGISGSYTYSVIGPPNKPVTYVGWGDSARFANWLNNAQPTGLQAASTTEDGAYGLNGAMTNAVLSTVSRKAGAHWVITSENEWYKAAYYHPAAQGGDVDSYWEFPTRTNSLPNSDQPPGVLGIQSNVANFFRNDSLANGYNDGYALTGSPETLSNNVNYLTDVGAYASASSPYGTFDQGGNVAEWNESLINGSSRGLRGGSWDSALGNLQASTYSYENNPSDGWYRFGFRVATVPEPTTLALAAVAGLIGLAMFVRCKGGRVELR